MVCNDSVLVSVYFTVNGVVVDPWMHCTHMNGQYILYVGDECSLSF